MLVCLLDAPDKASEYLKRGVPHDIEPDPRTKCYVQNIYSNKDPDRLIIRVEYWGETNPLEPTAYGRFVGRLSSLEKEIAEVPYATVVLDSVTALELAARYYSENNVNKFNAKGEETREGRLHYAFSMKACEQLVMTRWPNLIGTNAIVIAHYEEHQDESDDGERIVSKKTIAVPGKLAGRIGTQFSEVWRVYVDESGQRVLQTTARPRNQFNCKTSIDLPDGSYPHYKIIETLFEQEDGAKPVDTPDQG